MKMNRIIVETDLAGKSRSQGAKEVIPSYAFDAWDVRSRVSTASSNFAKAFKGFFVFGVIFTILILDTTIGLGLLVLNGNFVC
jgi:hypothetical protein